MNCTIRYKDYIFKIRGGFVLKKNVLNKVYIGIIVCCICLFSNGAFASSLENVSADKSWTIDLNYPVNRDSVTNESVFIQSESKNQFFCDFEFKNEDKSIVVLPRVNYNYNTNYTMKIANLVSKEGKLLKTPVIKDFFVEKESSSSEISKNTLYGSITRPETNYSKVNSEIAIIEFLEVYEGGNQGVYSKEQVEVEFAPGEYVKSYELMFGDLYDGEFAIAFKYKNELSSSRKYYSSNGSVHDLVWFNKAYFNEKTVDFKLDLDSSQNASESGNVGEDNRQDCKLFVLESIKSKVESIDVSKYAISDEDFMSLFDEIYSENYDLMKNMKWAFRVGHDIVNSIEMVYN